MLLMDYREGMDCIMGLWKSIKDYIQRSFIPYYYFVDVRKAPVPVKNI